MKSFRDLIKALETGKSARSSFNTLDKDKASEYIRKLNKELINDLKSQRKGEILKKIKKYEDKYIFQVALPGVSPNNISVSLQNGNKLHVMVSEYKESEEGEVELDEIPNYSGEEVSFDLTAIQEQILHRDIEAHVQVGMLNIHVPIEENEDGMNREIEIG